MSDFEDKTRVTQVVQLRDGGGGPGTTDCVVVIYSKEQGMMGKRFVLDRPRITVGRGVDCAIVLEGDSVSRRHCHFERRGTGWALVDDGSTNGSFVNEEQVQGEVALQNGDRVKVGPTILKFLSGSDAEAKYHEEIYRMTIVDGLTQAFNKRHLVEELEREMLRARRHARDLSVLMFDIDHFKRINDQFGHLAGDHVLRELAKVVQERIRRDEIFARYGGEEFALILPETPLEGARTLAESLRTRIGEHAFVFQGERIPVTISIGGAKLATADRSTNDVIARADAKLYEAKRGGRNRVCV